MNALDICIEQLKQINRLGYQNKCHIGNVGEAFAITALKYKKMPADNGGHDAVKMVGTRSQTVSIKTLYLRTGKNFKISKIKKNDETDLLLIVILDPLTDLPLHYLEIPYDRALSDASSNGSLSLGQYNKQSAWILI
jgi:hypothetical protein